MVFKNRYCNIRKIQTLSAFFIWNYKMDKNNPKNELDNDIRFEEQLLPATVTAPLSNRYQLAATSDNTRRAYQARC